MVPFSMTLSILSLILNDPNPHFKDSLRHYSTLNIIIIIIIIIIIVIIIIIKFYFRQLGPQT